MAKLEPKPGFDWGRVVWSHPNSRIGQRGEWFRRSKGLLAYIEWLRARKS